MSEGERPPAIRCREFRAGRRCRTPVDSGWQLWHEFFRLRSLSRIEDSKIYLASWSGTSRLPTSRVPNVPSRRRTPLLRAENSGATVVGHEVAVLAYIDAGLEDGFPHTMPPKSGRQSRPNSPLASGAVSYRPAIDLSSGAGA